MITLKSYESMLEMILNLKKSKKTVLPLFVFQKSEVKINEEQVRQLNRRGIEK